MENQFVVPLMAVAPIVAMLAISLISSAVGALNNAISRRDQKRELDKIRAQNSQSQFENRAWYNANFMTDYTQRADAQMLLRNLQDALKRRRDITASSAAITGASTAAQDAAKGHDARAIADTYGNIAAIGQRYKDNITNQFFGRRNLLENQQLGLDQQNVNDYNRQAQSMSNLMYNGINASAGALTSGMYNNTNGYIPPAPKHTPGWVTTKYPYGAWDYSRI